jgi:hypothetical protein
MTFLSAWIPGTDPSNGKIVGILGYNPPLNFTLTLTAADGQRGKSCD